MPSSESKARSAQPEKTDDPSPNRAVEAVQRARDELRRAVRELKASNEEAGSINKELHSSHEELRSYNEELTALNARLQTKMAEWQAIADDLSSLLSSAGIALVFLDRRFRIRRYTPAVKDLLELVPSDVGRPLADVRRKFDDPHLVEDAGQVLDRSSTMRREIISDSNHWYERRVLPFRTGDDRIDGVVITFLDITERKRMQERMARAMGEAKQAQAAAESASHAKDQFLASVSHELRTPLSGISMWAQMLIGNNELKPAEVKEAGEAIQRGVFDQKLLIDDLLDSARITSGRFSLMRKEIDLVQIVRHAVDAIRPKADEQGLTLQTDLPTDAIPLQADGNRLQQVIWNLIDNAIAHTPAGTGRIDVRLTRSADGVELVVADNGEGIASELLPHIFERFTQGARNLNGPRGLGLGLNIARQLVEAHGGTLIATSDGRNKGTTATMRLPVSG